MTLQTQAHIYRTRSVARKCLKSMEASSQRVKCSQGASLINSAVLKKIEQPSDKAKSENQHVKKPELCQDSEDSSDEEEVEEEEESENDDAFLLHQAQPEYPGAGKQYLTCGLYSIDLKIDELRSSGRFARKRKRRLDRDGRKKPLMPLPIYFGEYLANKEQDFDMPWDIVAAYHRGLIHREKRPSPYIKIRSNIFKERKRKKASKPPICQCKPPADGSMGCGKNCLNRIMYYECSPKYCPCDELCSNQRFQKGQSVQGLKVIWTGDRGFGLMTVEPIRKGQFIIEYRGEVLSRESCFARMKSRPNRKNLYFLEYNNGEVLDASEKGTDARYINHSCAPNCHIEKWLAPCGEQYVGVFASQNIPPGAELSYDYQFEACDGANCQPCFCGVENCRGEIGTSKSKMYNNGGK